MKPFSIAAIQLSLSVKDNFTLIEKKAREAIIRFPWLQMIVFSELAVGGVSCKNESFLKVIQKASSISKTDKTFIV